MTSPGPRGGRGTLHSEFLGGGGAPFFFLTLTLTLVSASKPTNLSTVLKRGWGLEVVKIVYRLTVSWLHDLSGCHG